MKKKILRVLSLALVLVLTALQLSGCGLLRAKAPNYSRGDSAAFVRAAARAVTTGVDSSELFYAGEDPVFCDLSAKPTLQPYFALLNFRAKADAEDPDLVHYSCRIPGLVGSCFNMAYDVCFQANRHYSKWVKAEGDVRVVTDAGGRRQIDISGEDNVFAVYAALRYVNPMFFLANGVDISKGLSDRDRVDGLNILLNRGCEAYAGLLGGTAEDYAQGVVVPELEDYQNNMRKISRTAGRTGYGFLNWIYHLSPTGKAFILMIGGGAVLYGLYILAVSVVFAVKDRKSSRRVRMPQDLLSGAGNTAEWLNGLSEQATDSPGMQMDRFSRRFLQEKRDEMHLSEARAIARMAVLLARNPEDSEPVERFLCKTVARGLSDSLQIKPEDSGSADTVHGELLTAAGWAAAALGRILARKLSPGQIAESQERLSGAIDHSNETIGALRACYERREALVEELRRAQAAKDASLQQSLSGDYQHLEKEIGDLELEYDRGIGNYMLDQGAPPLAWLVFLLRDSQNRYPRFIKQGVIMGLVDWLTANRSHPEAAKLLETVVSVRADMIRSDNELTFFEVRVPMGCSRKDYAVLLSDVLHCANPSLRYGSTEELLTRAEKEIPGVMDLLYACPLRLIDPANARTLGFYQFKPYAHAMWVQYTPPLRTGPVISRYHEVDDRTRPLSSGLNLQLFRDCYAVIPTLFHEHQHFLGDRNEASVFLKTQLFSIRFYQKYPQASARADGVFARLTDMLGLPPTGTNRAAFNSLIESCYGKQLSEAEAKRQAEAEIANLNRAVDAINAGETWDPEKKLPRFSDGEDRRNRDRIRDILIRFGTVPKSLTAEEFEQILRAKPEAAPKAGELPLSATLKTIERLRGRNTGVDHWLSDMLAVAAGHRFRDGSDPGADGPEMLALLRSHRLDPETCLEALTPWLFDKSSRNPKSLEKYLRLAQKRARELDERQTGAQHLLYVLLQHPTAAMKEAGIVPQKR